MLTPPTTASAPDFVMQIAAVGSPGATKGATSGTTTGANRSVGRLAANRLSQPAGGDPVRTGGVPREAVLAALPDCMAGFFTRGP